MPSRAASKQSIGRVTLALALLGCGRGRSAAEQVPSATPTSSAQAAPAHSIVPSATTTPSAVVSARRREREPEPAEKVLMRWNAALNHHSIDELRPLYAPQVLFYGQRRTAESVLEAKRKAFDRDPKFRQRISDVRVEDRDGRISITFEKRSGKALKAVYGSLVLEQQPGGLEIVDESDMVTDAKLRPHADTCPDAAMTVTTSQSVIQTDIERVAREFPDVNPGGLSYDQTEHTDRYSGSLGYFHPDHYEARWYIDAAAGKLTIRDAYTGVLLPLTSAQQALIQRLCTGTFEDSGDASSESSR